MTTWTPAAEAFFRSYLASQFGARPIDDVAHDLRSHVHEELTQRGVSQVTRGELKHVFDQLGIPDEPVWDRPKNDVPPPPQPEPKSPPTPFRRNAWFSFTIIIPLVVAVLELTYHWCAQAFFDPMPTPWHVLLVFTTPLVAAWLKLRSEPWTPQALKAAASLSGFTLVVASYYALITIWWAPFAFIGILLIGLGLIPLAPQLAFLGVLESRKTVWKHLQSAQEIPWQQWSRCGIALGIIIVSILEVPSMIAQVGISMAKSDDAMQRDQGLSIIRAMHYEKSILKSCYRQRNTFGRRGAAAGTDAAGMFASFFDSSLKPHQAQAIYFQLTGEPFNSVAPPPRLGSLTSSKDTTIDTERGGDRVGGRLHGLSMDTSRLDIHLEAAARLSYTEWTINFNNASTATHEARFQMLLPEGGVVSRLTLWVNGEPQEAAFGSNSQVKWAYKDVVLVKKRDPVLVTTSGTDRVLVQCFPILPLGCRMQIRLGITAPWSEGSPKLTLPKIIERNFNFSDSLEHAIWVQGDGFGQETQMTVSNDQLMEGGVLDALKPLTQHLPDHVWTRDPFACEGEAIVVGTRVTETAEPADKVIVVLDDSIAMLPYVDSVTNLLRNVSSDQLGIILASEAARGSRAVGSLDVLDRWYPKHGVDNAPALGAASKAIGRSKTSAIVWIHGPQPPLRPAAKLQQAVERSGWIHLYDVPMTHGTNTVAQVLKHAPRFKSGPRMGPNFEGRTTHFIQELLQPTPKLAWQWTRQTNEAPRPEGATEVSDQFARYTKYLDGMTAWSQTIRSKRWYTELARYQLVTPMSGAVVLERKEQYRRHDLEQADESTVPIMPTIPSVPEPSTTLLLLFGMSATLLRRRRQ